MFWNTEVAYKYKMSSMQAALGLAQLERIDELVDRKRDIFAWYQRELSAMAGVTLNSQRPGVKNTYWMVTVVVDPSYGLTSRELMRLFDDQVIDTRPFFPPLSSLPAFNRNPSVVDAKDRNPVAYDIGGRSVNLPSALILTEDDVDRVCTVLLEILETAKGNGS